MLNLEEGAELTLPDGVRKIVTALNFDGSLGRYGDEFDWPVATLSDGRRRDLRRMQPKTAANAVKYFVKGKMPEGWCRLTYPRSGCELRLSWPAERVPYFAVLPDEGGWQDLYGVFLEPATASLTDWTWLASVGSAPRSGLKRYTSGTWRCEWRDRRTTRHS